MGSFIYLDLLIGIFHETMFISHIKFNQTNFSLERVMKEVNVVALAAGGKWHEYFPCHNALFHDDSSTYFQKFMECILLIIQVNIT